VTNQILHFLLVPDGSAARRLRRILAEQSASSGVVVGTWSELIERACRAFLVPASTNDNDSGFRQALGGFKDAFWTESLSVAPVETAKAIKSSLIQIISATDPMADIEVTGLDELPDRPRRHLKDLFQLAKSLEGQWPQELSMMRMLFSAISDDALHIIRVYRCVVSPHLTRWQVELVEKLNQNANNSDLTYDEKFTQILNDVLSNNISGKLGSSLHVLQERLYENVTDKSEVDESVQWVGTRDFLQEAEITAGMVQTMLNQNPDLEPAHIGLLIPDRFEYARALDDACTPGGIAFSGLPVERRLRDLGREVVFHFLYCRQEPTPIMAMATCLTSPLMPWSRQEGARLAQKVIDGDYQLRSLHLDRPKARKMLNLLRDGDNEPASLVDALSQFVLLLEGGKNLEKHVLQAKKAIEQLKVILKDDATIDWTELRQTVSPDFITSAKSPDFNLEGVTVWLESQEFWRPVKHLIVLGFTKGHYPSVLANDPVFSVDDLKNIRELTGLQVSTPSEVLANRRIRFKRQLGAVAESITFLVPHHDTRGESQSPSESLVFMHQLFKGSGTVDERILDLDNASDQPRIRHLAFANRASPQSPREILVEDLNFDRNLMALGGDEGQLKRESPSSLETLMISRLAWLLRRLRAEPLLWTPESATPALLGTLAHAVFEGLFRPEESLPDRDVIPGRVRTLLQDATLSLAPFLLTPEWQVELRNFTTETIKAAQAWRDVLRQLGADVLANETWLQGTWSEIPIHGQTDLLLGLPENRLLVVDYKRSKSTSIRPRMEKGYDIQASLYRVMLESGGPRKDEEGTLLNRIRKSTETGVVYYMLNDQVSLSDSRLPESGNVPGWYVLENEVAGEAMEGIKQRVEEVSTGEVRLNRQGDVDSLEKQTGIKPYALETSPLIELFTMAGESEEAP